MLKNRYKLRYISLIFLSVLPFLVLSQERTHISIDWKGIQEVEMLNSEPVKAITFAGAVHTSLNNFAPLYHRSIQLPDGVRYAEARIVNQKFVSSGSGNNAVFPFIDFLADTLKLQQESGLARGVAFLDISFIPIVLSSDGSFDKLVSFDIEVSFDKITSEVSLKKQAYADHSVLSSGKWYKVKVNQSGICKVTYNDLAAMGVDMQTIDPDRIRVYGKPGGMLPESNKSFRYDDLPENAIQVVCAQPGKFASGDYFLFYASSPHEVAFNAVTRKFEHFQHLYSDYAYYFLNFDRGTGKRIQLQEQSTEPSNYKCTSFSECKYYEKDLYNFIKSGKQWIGDRLDFSNPSLRIPDLDFENVMTERQAWIRYRLVARASGASNFSINTNSSTIVSKSIAAYTTDTFIQEAVETKSFMPVEGEQEIHVQYNPPNSSSFGYIDWIEVNVPRRLQFGSGQLIFAEPFSVMPGFISEFNLAAASLSVRVWEITDPVNVSQINASLVGDTLKFVLPTDTIRKFIAWDNSAFNTVEFDGVVVNQDLHGIPYADMIIVTHPDFLEQANRLANHRMIMDGMNVVVATNQEIYNEFSAGAPDVSAIRDFARMLYLRPDNDRKLRFLLLFGDGSYDYKNHLPTNTNYVLSFQSFESRNLVFSTASDDFFGLFDSNEGQDASGKLDIGIGRFPVDDAEQAKSMVDKCIFYDSGTPDNLGDWKNSLCFIADDEDSNTHIRQVEDQVTPAIEKEHAVFNLNKVYLDAYTQVTTSSGTRYPEVNARINDQVKKGVLIMNYTGHGGEMGWATESILTLGEINSWTNFRNMPVFVTATCEFSRCDDPDRVSAGERVFLNPLGGGVALFTTTRLANAGNNVELTIDLYDTLFSMTGEELPRFGNVIAFAKNENSNVGLIRNFMLIGDPSMHLAIPRYKVFTTKVNGKPVNEGADTIRATSEVSVEGIIGDRDSTLVESFNGIVNVKVFDKYKWMMTRGNDPTSFKRYFDVQENILYQGKASVTNGRFTFSFIVPKDIDYSYGIGKISYYASNETVDASGYSDKIVIGGLSDGMAVDMEGPEIKLFMNDERFADGGVTGENPLLIAYLSDSSGLNTVGNGIGHDIVATLDGNSGSSFVLNDYYVSDLDSYKSGKLRHYLSGLNPGPHTLTLKAWDVFNNSSEATIHFTVNKNLAIRLIGMNAYPNPFDSEIKVDIEHNLFDASLEISMDIFSLNGTLIRSVSPVTNQSQGYYSETLYWDGRTSNGGPAGDGLYLLRVTATDGKTTSSRTARVLKITK